MDQLCTATWPEWHIKCELERGHSGAHHGQHEGKLAYWGGHVAEWVRV